MALRDLLAKIGFEVDEKPLNKVERSLDGIKGMLEAFVGIEAIKRVYELGERFGELGERLAVSSASAGISVEAFQRLAYAARQSAVGSDEMEGAMARLSRRLFESKHGSAEAAHAFRLAGLTGAQVRGFKTSEDALAALADQFQRIQDPVKKAALAQELMGRGSIHMVGFLSKGSAAIRAQGDEAQRLGLILGSQQVENLEKLSQSFHKLQGFMTALGSEIAAYIAPVFSHLVNDMLLFYKANKDIINVNIRNFLNAMAYGLGFVWGGVKILSTALIALAKHFHMEGHILPTLAKIGGLVSAMLSLISVIRIASFLLGPWVATLGALAGALGLVVVAAHDLYAAFSGEKTWTQGLLEFLGVAQAVQDVFFAIFDTVGKVVDLFTTGGLEKMALSLIGLGGKTTAMASPQAGATTVANTTNRTVVGGNSHAVNAPVTINVPQGANPHEVGKRVQAGVKDHLDRVTREVSRSTGTTVAW